MPNSTAYQKLFAPVTCHAPFLNGWQRMDDDALAKVPSGWREWLFSEGSLTTRLMAFSKGSFRVRVLAEGWKTATRYEAFKLGLDSAKMVRVRDVELLCNEVPVVFARTVIPLTLYQREKTVFNTMGTKPLGHYLFKEGQIKNAKRDIKLCDADGSGIYARATPYQFRGSEILVREFFLHDDLLKT
ncbi:MAG: chorismate lyase [Gammaproteobacteria bacterium]|nr:chorismate lyase [Gammaproteobacteria bacterium]